MSFLPPPTPRSRLNPEPLAVFVAVRLSFVSLLFTPGGLLLRARLWILNPALIIRDCYVKAQMKCVGSDYRWGICVQHGLFVDGEVGICSCRYDEKCNGDDSLFSIPAATRPGCWGSERAFICSHSRRPLMYSTEKGTLSNVWAGWSACVFVFLHTWDHPLIAVFWDNVVVNDAPPPFWHFKYSRGV